MDQNSPAFIHISPTRIWGRSSRRLIIILKTSGCVHALRKGGGCIFCGFRELTTKGIHVKPAAVLSQFKKGMDTYDIIREQIGEVDIYNSGSFLSPMEIPPDVRLHIFDLLSEYKSIEKIFIESRPEFVISESENLKHLKSIIKGKTLEIGIGLETVDDETRLKVLNKGFTLELFIAAAKILAGMRIDLLAYILIKAPGHNESEAINDAVKSIEFLASLQDKLKLRIKAALQPTFIPRNTPIEELHIQGRFSPPMLWSVIEIIKKTAQFPIEIEVGLSDENLSQGRIASNCLICQKKTTETLEKFNSTGDRSLFRSLTCSCKKKWEELIKSVKQE